MDWSVIILELIILELLWNYFEIGCGRSLYYSVNGEKSSKFSFHINQLLIPKDLIPPQKNFVFPVLCGKFKQKIDKCLTWFNACFIIFISCVHI